MEINAIIEIPKGSNIKYEYSVEEKRMFVDRILPGEFSYPFNYGRIENTLMPDGNHLDILILNDKPILPTVAIKVKIIGVLLFEDGDTYEEKVNDDHILAVPGDSIDYRYHNINDIEDISEMDKSQLYYFFTNYKKHEGKYSKVNGFSNRYQAIRIIEMARRRFLVRN